jgi:uncharacterized protein
VTTVPSETLLNDRLLRSWLRCKRRAWLDRFGDPAERQWTAHRELQLDEQRRCFSMLFPQRPQRGEAAASAAAAAVVGLRLRGSLGGLPLEAHPPLLQRLEGQSRWGAHAYRPVLFRQGRRTTREHRLVLALWGRLLESDQGAPVRSGLVLALAGRGMEQEALPLTGGLPRQLDDARSSWRTIWRGPSRRRWWPIARNACSAVGRPPVIRWRPPRATSAR